LLEEKGIPYSYRDYRKDPLDRAEIEKILSQLGVTAQEVLRKKDRAAKEAGLTGEESQERLVELMTEYPTLLQRPIAVLGDQAVLGRPPERLLDLVG
jgi:arsenate reductase